MKELHQVTEGTKGGSGCLWGREGVSEEVCKAMNQIGNTGQSREEKAQPQLNVEGQGRADHGGT